MSRFSVSPPSQRWALALMALAVASTLPAYAAQSAAQLARPKGSGAPAPVRAPDDPDAPTVVQAEQITGRQDRDINLERNVDVVRGQTRVAADTACFKQVEDELTASGSVRMWRYGDRYTGETLQLNLDSGKGWVTRPTYFMALSNGQGNAARVDFLSDDEAVVRDGTYSTCEGTNPDWYLKSSTLNLDTGRDLGTAGKTIIYFKGVPILGTPAMSFSLSGARKSGWLPPSVGFGSKGAAELTVPYYFNIAPNRDLTVFPRIIPSRGIQFGATGRYEGWTDDGVYIGETHAEVLLHDSQTKTNRWLINSAHTQTIAAGLSYGWNVRGASDDQYPSDFSKSISTSAERQLLRELRTDYVQQYWSLNARVQSYQILQDPAAALDPTLTVARPYDRLPQINFHAGRYDVAGFDWSTDIELTRFSHPGTVTNGVRVIPPQGNRIVVAPQISYPWVRPGYFITPKLMLNASSYQLDYQAATDPLAAKPPTSLSRVLPTFSLDSGLVFERDTTLFGKAITQTLEPRLFYVYTPYKDQSAFPNFDSAESGFNFAQIFNENRFIGSDRISDANQVTAAITSRFIEANGAERLRLSLGERFYFRDQRVQLVSTTPVVDTHSDILAAASGRISENWAFESAVQYTASAHQVYSSNYGIQWVPAEKKVINAEYRYQKDTFKNIDVSSQWPISLRWYGIGRVSYSLLDRKILESLVGLEYKADCWVFRMGAQRFVTTAQNTSTPIFFQLELNGLSKLGFGNPLESFYKSIPGYQRVNSAAR
jgi:LPS-assembly protein